MTAYLRINHFIESANQAVSLQKYLVADAQGLGVSQKDLPNSFNADGTEQNRRTWKVFRECLVATIGQQKFDWICHRYRDRLNFTHLEQNGAPLLSKHVELFSIGSSQLSGKDIKARFPQKLREVTREQLNDRVRQVQPFPVIGNYISPVEISGSPSYVGAYFVHNKTLMDKEKQLLFSDVDRLAFPAWLERFTKVTVNRELLTGQIIPVPGQDGRRDYYKVYRKIATGDGLVAYALKPATIDSTLKPIIAFRPSQWAFSNEDAFETYLNDVQENVGEMGWAPAKRLFDQLMNDRHFRPRNEKVTIAGYSLGGAHAQHFLEHYYDKTSHAIFYSDPSVDNATAERAAEKINRMPRCAEPLNIQIFRMKGDFCHYVGGKHVGWGVTHPDVNIQLSECDHENKKVSGFYLHAHRLFDNTVFPYQMQHVEDPQALYDHLDNSKRGPDVLWYERVRRIWGTVAYYSIKVLSALVNMISGIFGVKVLRSSRDAELA